MGYRRKIPAWIAIALVSVLAGAPGTASAESYQYDAAGRLSRVIYDTGQIVDYFYDMNNNVTGVVSGGQTGVNPEDPGILETSLGPASPNPATRVARLRFALAEGGEVHLRFFDVAGRQVVAIEKTYPAGSYEAQVNVQGWAAGVYFYRFETGGYGKVGRVVVVR